MYKRLITTIVLMIVMVGMSMAQSDEATFPITIVHDFGSTTITAPAQRIVVLEWTYAENLLALGVMPVGVADIAGYNNWVKIEPQLDEMVVDVGTRQEPNLEVIAELQPDLIIAPSFRVSANYEALNAIAPTITFNSYPTDISHYEEMVNTFTTMGQLVDRATEAQAVLDAMNAYFASANQALIEAGRGGETFILSQTFLSSEVPTFRLFTDNALAVQVLEQIGLTNAWEDAPQQYGFSTVDFEAFVGIDDTNFFYIAQPDYQATLVESPLWSGLPFVQSDRAYWLGGDVWLFGGPLSMEVLVDTILNALGISLTSACEDGFRLIRHVMGDTCVPQNPMRVVVLDTGELDNALALGATVVGAPVNDALQYQEYLSDQLAGITDIGAISTPNLEVIISLAPDLILGSQQRYADIYDQLSQIAPTVFTASLRVPWQDNFVVHADALNKSDEAQLLLARYADRIAQVQASLGDAIDTTISVIRFRPGQVRLYLKSSYIGYILQDVGLQRPDSQNQDVFSAEISLEQVQDADADYIFITGYAQDDSDLQTFLNSPLWQTLTAVQNGRAIDVNDDTWVSGLGVQSALLVLDDLERILGQSQ